jgi:hypothetical protein
MVKAVMALALLASTGSALAQTATEMYDLRDRCKISATVQFEKAHGVDGTRSAPNTTATHSFRAHYNVRLNRCFYLEMGTVVFTDQKLGWFSDEMLYDLLDNSIIGVMTVNNAGERVVCRLADVRCESKQDWDSLLKPYMGD